MSWRRTQRLNKRHQRGERRTDDEIRNGIRKPMPPPTRITDPAIRDRLERYKEEMVEQLADWDEWYE